MIEPAKEGAGGTARAAVASGSRSLNFGSEEIRKLSASRQNATRLADILYFDQQARGPFLDTRHADVFIAQVHECEATLAPFR